jgi:hypothetical protein
MLLAETTRLVAPQVGGDTINSVRSNRTKPDETRVAFRAVWRRRLDPGRRRPISAAPSDVPRAQSVQTAIPVARRFEPLAPEQ